MSIFPGVPESQGQRRQLRRELQRQAEAARDAQLSRPTQRAAAPLDAELSGRRLGLYKVPTPFSCTVWPPLSWGTQAPMPC